MSGAQTWHQEKLVANDIPTWRFAYRSLRHQDLQIIMLGQQSVTEMQYSWTSLETSVFGKGWKGKMVENSLGLYFLFWVIYWFGSAIERFLAGLVSIGLRWVAKSVRDSRKCTWGLVFLAASKLVNRFWQQHLTRPNHHPQIENGVWVIDQPQYQWNTWSLHFVQKHIGKVLLVPFSIFTIQWCPSLELETSMPGILWNMGRIQGTDWGQDVLEWALLCGSQTRKIDFPPMKFAILNWLFSLIWKQTFDWGRGKAAVFSFTSFSVSLVGSCSKCSPLKEPRVFFWIRLPEAGHGNQFDRGDDQGFMGNHMIPTIMHDHQTNLRSIWINLQIEFTLHTGHLGATVDSRWFTTFFLFCADTGLGTSCFGRVEFGTDKKQLAATCWAYCTWFRGHKVIVKTFAQHHTQL